ncbi:MAG: hypothetical protein ABDH23_01280 [Endomicrobiia bacterium]
MKKLDIKKVSVLFFFLIFAVPLLSSKIKIKIKTPPKVVITPKLVIIPESNVMYVANFDDFEVFYFDGVWFCYYDGYWWKTKDLSKPWVMVEIKYVPSAIIKLPYGWREKIKHKHSNHHEKIIIVPKKGKKKR